MNNIELVEQIEATHHEYLKRELPLVSELAKRVAEAHSKSDPRLSDLVLVLRRFVDRLLGHMRKEERSLFPAIRELEEAKSRPSFWFGTIEKPIWSAEAEHRDADRDLQSLHILTDDFSAPTWASETHRILLDKLREIESDILTHVDKEERTLFPGALDREREFGARGDS